MALIVFLVLLFSVGFFAVVMNFIDVYLFNKKIAACAAAREARRKMKSYRIQGSGWMRSSTKFEGSPGHSPVREADIGVRVAKCVQNAGWL